jgi:hypothetical protein
MSLAQCAILDNDRQLLTRINNKAKVRQSTKSVVLGKGEGKVISYEDIEEARIKRSAKDATKGKGNVVGSVRVLCKKQMSQSQGQGQSKK